MPLRSSAAVDAMCTEESTSSTQSTGTSWTRSPACSASTRSSVSKNHASSSQRGSRWSAAWRVIALNPHWASENDTPIVLRRSRLYEREMNSRLPPRTTREDPASRVPIATSEWPESSGATSGSSAARSVDRSSST